MRFIYFLLPAFVLGAEVVPAIKSPPAIVLSERELEQRISGLEKVYREKNNKLQSLLIRI